MNFELKKRFFLLLSATYIVGFPLILISGFVCYCSERSRSRLERNDVASVLPCIAKPLSFLLKD